MKHKLLIISGISGAIGNALLAEYSRRGFTIYGLSRKGLPMQHFLTKKQLLPLNTFITSIGDFSEKNIAAFVNAIDFQDVESVSYFHCVGHYPFEIDSSGNHIIENDHDGDGINDLTHYLSYAVFTDFTKALERQTRHYDIPARSIIFGAIADRHKPVVHESWWRTIAKTIEYMKMSATDSFGMHLVNISSVACAHELTTRPFVFMKTDSDIRFWLQPHELASRLALLLDPDTSFSGFHEYEIFNKRPEFSMHYYEDSEFTPRKVAELY